MTRIEGPREYGRISEDEPVPFFENAADYLKVMGEQPQRWEPSTQEPGEEEGREVWTCGCAFDTPNYAAHYHALTPCPRHARALTPESSR